MSENEFLKKKYIPKDAEDLLHDFHTDLSVGDILRRARMRAGLDIPQISEQIRISPSYIEAIEDNRLEKLPGRIYALGFIKTYADFLELDSEKIIQLLKRQSGTKVEPKPLKATMQVEEEHSLPTLKNLFIILLILIGALTIHGAFLGHKTDRETIPSVPKDLKEQVTLLTKPELPPEEDNIAKVTSLDSQTNPEQAKLIVQDKVHPVVLKALDNVWLEVKAADGRVVLSRVLSIGEEYWVPEDQENLVMTLGNAGGLQIIVDGNPLPLLGKTGKVIRNLSLDPQYLKDLLKKIQR